MRIKLIASVAGAAIVATGPAQANLVIDATFDPSLSSTAVATIDQAISFYESEITTNTTVYIDFFNMTGGLGENESYVELEPYSNYYNALIANATSANDFTALTSTSGATHLSAGADNPVTGTSAIVLKNPLARALGFSAPEGSFSTAGGAICNYNGDSCVGVNLSITNDPTDGVAGGYNLETVVEHEIDEALGLGSTLPNGGGSLPSSPEAEDLFRFSAPGVRTFTLNNGVASYNCAGASAAYFSINGGATNLANFNNCANGGDYGDWAFGAGLVQDAYSNGASPLLTPTSPEVTALDVMGYSMAQNVPEPSTWALVLVGFAGFGFARQHTRRVANSIA